MDSEIKKQKGDHMLKLIFNSIQKRTSAKKLLEVYKKSDYDLKHIVKDKNINAFLEENVSF